MKKQHIQFFARYGVILLFAVTMLVPFFWMIITSFKDPVKVFERPMNWWVDSFDFSNYLKFFTDYDGWRYIWNTVKLCAINIVGVVVSNAIVAYAVAFLKFRYKKVIMALLLITMMMPGTVTFFPQFIVYVKLGWYGTGARMNWMSYSPSTENSSGWKPNRPAEVLIMENTLLYAKS